MNPSNRRTTIASIAKRAGVSPGLVSSFLSGREYRSNGKAGIRVSRDTGDKIRKTCRKMGYWPEKPVAFNRIYPELAEICLMAHDGMGGLQRSRFSLLILSGILEASVEVRTKVSISYFDPDADFRKNPEKLPLAAIDAGVSKFILTAQQNDSFIESLLARNKHVVYVSRDVGIPGVASIVPAYRQAAQVALQYLFGLGHRRIGFVAEAYFKDNYSSNEFRSGIQDAQKRLGIVFPENALFPEMNSIEETIESLFSSPNPPTALFGFDDISAEMAIHLLAKRGLSVPGDVSVVGCNDELEAAQCSPPLTTVHLPIMEMGRRAVELVNRMMISPEEEFDHHLVLPVYLVERASTHSLHQ